MSDFSLGCAQIAWHFVRPFVELSTNRLFVGARLGRTAKTHEGRPSLTAGVGATATHCKVIICLGKPKRCHKGLVFTSSMKVPFSLSPCLMLPWTIYDSPRQDRAGFIVHLQETSLSVCWVQVFVLVSLLQATSAAPTSTSTSSSSTSTPSSSASTQASTSFGFATGIARWNKDECNHLPSMRCPAT